MEMLPPGASMLSPSLNLKILKVESYLRSQAINIPNNLPHLLENLMLHEDEDRSNLLSEHVGVGGGCEPFSSQGGHVQAAGQLVEEAWVT